MWSLEAFSPAITWKAKTLWFQVFESLIPSLANWLLITNVHDHGVNGLMIVWQIFVPIDETGGGE